MKAASPAWPSDQVLVGAEIQPTGFRTTGMVFVIDPEYARQRAREMKEQGLGNLLAVRVPSLLAGCGQDAGNLTGKGYTIQAGSPAAEFVALCHELGLKVRLVYGTYTPEALRELRTRWPGTVIGIEIGEILGHLGSPKDLDSSDMAAGHAAAMERLRMSVRAVKDVDPETAVVSTDGTVLHHLSAEAGCDLNMTELFVGNCPVHLSAIRGAARAFGGRPFGAYLATGWFGGSNADPHKADRLRLGLHAAYLHGATSIVNESGTWGLYEFGDQSGPEDPLAVAERDVLRRFYAFTRRDRRPRGGPLASVAFLQGRLDGWSGHTQSTLWASKSIGSVPADPERGWDLLDVAYPHYGGYHTTPAVYEEAQWFSGAPYGHVDLVPARADAECLARYRGILCVGWNTMDAALWKRLAAYVESGGAMFLSALHLTTETDHGKVAGDWPGFQFSFLDADLYERALGLRILGRKRETRGGAHYGRRAKLLRVEEPFASLRTGDTFLVQYPIPVADVQFSGAQPVVVSDKGDPILIRARYGRGEFWCFTGWCWPGHPGIRRFMRAVVAGFLETHRGPVQVNGAPAVDWGCYPLPEGWKLYLLNTDMDRGCRVEIGGPSATRAVRLPAGGFRVVEVR